MTAHLDCSTLCNIFLALVTWAWKTRIAVCYTSGRARAMSGPSRLSLFFKDNVLATGRTHLPAEKLSFLYFSFSIGAPSSCTPACATDLSMCQGHPRLPKAVIQEITWTKWGDLRCFPTTYLLPETIPSSSQQLQSHCTLHVWEDIPPPGRSQRCSTASL